MDPLIETQAGNYRLVSKLGAGGMGDVYQGVHVTIGSRVAIKVLHRTSRSEAETEQRFLREAQAVNRIAHDGIVKVLDAGRLASGQPYLVMELLEGRSLSDQLRAGGLPIVDACRVIVDVLDAIAAAHAVGVVHRDLKPANIFLTTAGRTVVLDFGIAKLVGIEETERLTMTGVTIGTPHYMAPEQIADREVSPATDLYSAGVVLFELLCAKPPFEGPLIDIMNAHLYAPPPAPRLLRPDVPAALSDVVLKALAKAPTARFESASVMRDALCAATGMRGPPPRPITPPIPISTGLVLPTEHVPDGSLHHAPPPERVPPTQRARTWLALASGAAAFTLIALGAWKLGDSKPAPKTPHSGSASPDAERWHVDERDLPPRMKPADLALPPEPTEPTAPIAPLPSSAEPEADDPEDVAIVRGVRGSCQSTVHNNSASQRITCKPGTDNEWTCRCERNKQLVKSCKTTVAEPCSADNCCGF